MKNEIQTSGRTLGQLCAEPFLAIGLIVFWTTALPAAALFFGVITAVEHVRAFVTAPATAGTRLVGRPA